MVLLSLLLACSGSAPSSPSPSAETPGCDEGELHDGETCVPEACGMTPWGDVEGTIFVDEAAAEGGDGTEAAPFQTIGAAVAVAGTDDVVAVAAGTYKEKLALTDRDLTLAGRCSALVTLQDPGSSGGGTGPIELVPPVTFNVDGGAAPCTSPG